MGHEVGIDVGVDVCGGRLVDWRWHKMASVDCVGKAFSTVARAPLTFMLRP
jgi:hypothetical protein